MTGLLTLYFYSLTGNVMLANDTHFIPQPARSRSFKALPQFVSRGSSWSMAARCSACSSLRPAWRGGGGGWSCRSWRTVGAEGHKSQPPAEQGHQIKVYCYDLVHSAVKAAADNYKERKLVVPLVSSQINITHELKGKCFEGILNSPVPYIKSHQIALELELELDRRGVILTTGE